MVTKMANWKTVAEHPFRMGGLDVCLYAPPILERYEEIRWVQPLHARPFAGMIRMRDCFRVLLGREVLEARLHPDTLDLLRRSAEVQMRLKVLAPVNAILINSGFPEGFWEQQLGFPLKVDPAVGPGSVLFFSVPTGPIFGDPPLVYVGALHVV